MKFALSLPSILVFLYFVTFSFSTNAQGSFLYISSSIKANSTTKQLRVNSSQQAAQMAKGRFGGKVLKVQKKNSGYRVKLIKTDGHIISVYVDAITGRISGGK